MLCYIIAYLLESQNGESSYSSPTVSSKSHWVLTSQIRLMSNNYFLNLKYFNIKLKLIIIKVTFIN
jgi:hypothetical protein